MIKIRSTEKLATSNSNGLCDILRVLSNFKFDLEKGIVSTIVTDYLFQENTVSKEGEDDYVERVIIENKKGVAYSFSINEIDGFYQQIGTDITKNIGFSEGLKRNLADVLIYQTFEAKRQTMTNWVSDTEHILVPQFSDAE